MGISRKIVPLCLWAMISGVCAAPAEVADAKSLRTQFIKRHQPISSWSASFTQTLVLPGLRQPILSSGTLIYRSPDAVRLDFDKPQGQYVLVVGDEVFLQRTDRSIEVKSLADDPEGKPFQLLLSFLHGAPFDGESSYDSQLSRKGSQYRLVLKRKADESNELPDQITHVFDVESLDAKEVRVNLPDGGSVAMQFDGAKWNIPVDAGRFAPPQVP